MNNEMEMTADGVTDSQTAVRKKRQMLLLVRVFLFFIVLGCFGMYLLNVFDMKDDKGAEKVFHTFYTEEENTLDGIYIGSSSAYRFWIPPYAYDQSGMAISNLGTGSQPVVLQKYIITEALKTQSDMKVILIDIRSMLNDDKRLKEADIRRVTDSFHILDAPLLPSRNRTAAVNAALEYFESQDANINYTKAFYYFPFLKYHNRWQSDITPKDLTGMKFKNRYKGFVFTSSGSLSVKRLEQPFYTDETAGELDPVKEEILRDLLNYCRRLDQEVIFVSSPYQISEEEQKHLNACGEIIEAAGFTVLDFNTSENAERIGLNWETDFMDKKHVNVYGAMKYTACVAEYLSEQYGLADHRDSEKYKSWQTSSDRFYMVLERLEQMKEEGQLELNSDE